MAGPTPHPPPRATSPATTYYNNTSATRINTDAYLFRTLQTAHPDSTITIVPEWTSPLKAWASSTSEATITPHSPPSDNLSWTLFIPPNSRLHGPQGLLATEAFYESFLLTYKSQQFLIYFIDGRDGTEPYNTRNFYIIHPATTSGLLRNLLLSCGRWANALHNEIWVFNQGYWSKDSALYASIMASSWDNVILHSALKEDLIATITRFYDSRDTYHRLGVPWKRGIIFHGPPGNGKTISIKATMHTLYTHKPDPIPTLYVQSLKSFLPSEYAITSIFEKARAEAPCYLVFEDLDSLVTDDVRSFFLNAADGLSENEGILMVGSTNHLERLDPGISKRPSRFDRKYLFANPDESLRERYAEFWRGKVNKGNREDVSTTTTHVTQAERDFFGEKEDCDEHHDDATATGTNTSRGEKDGKGDDDVAVEFPRFLCKEIARITHGFSFAYMQEAFVSALLTIATYQKEEEEEDHQTDGVVEKLVDDWEDLSLDSDHGKATEHDKDGKSGKHGKHGDNDRHKEKDLDKYVLWRELKKQVEMLRGEMRKGRE